MNEQSVLLRHINGSDYIVQNAMIRDVQVARTAIFICHEGSGDISIDGQRIHVESKSIMVYFPFSVLRIYNHTNNLYGTIISGDLEAIQPMLYRVADFNGLFLIRKHPYTNLSDHQYANFNIYISLISDKLKEKTVKIEDATGVRPIREIATQQVQLLGNSLMLEVMACYTRFEEASIKTACRKDEILQRFIQQLYKHYRNEHEVTYYAEQQYLTSRYFSAIIKEKSGKTPSQWIATALLVEAKQLISRTTMNIKEISDYLHFPNQSYFGKWFKKLTGIGPLEFKNGREVIIKGDEELASIIKNDAVNNPLIIQS